MAQEAPTFRADSALALVRFHVVRNKEYVTNPKPEDLVLLEDGAARNFTIFENAMTGRAMAVELALLFDTSGSVANEHLLDPLAFKESLLDNLENVSSIGLRLHHDTLDRYCRQTRDFGTLKSAFAELAKSNGKRETIKLRLPPKRKAFAGGATWIYAAVSQAAREAAPKPGRRAWTGSMAKSGRS